MTTTTSTADRHAAFREVLVWDPAVRIFHWSLVAAFIVAYAAAEEIDALHFWAGYTVGGLILFRVFWGFVGPRHARFSDFVTSPFQALAYFLGLLKFTGERHVGHSPAGGWMVLLLLAAGAAIVWTGLEYQADRFHTGPLAYLRGDTAVPAIEQAAPAPAPALTGEEDDDDDEGEGERGERGPRSVWSGYHEVAVNLTLLLIFLHIAGVVLASVVHHENLARAMFTGRKRAP